MATIERQRTAIRRKTLSRPIRLAIEDGLLTPTQTVFDYGCGHGDDVRLLREAGYACDGWDPLTASTGARTASDLVNLGYVINVIEEPGERDTALRTAWDLAREVLVVSARLVFEDTGRQRPLNDGVVTSRSTFQKFFTQPELQGYVRQVLNEEPVAGAPGVFYVFRNPGRRESFLASQSRRAAALPRLRTTDRLYAAHREMLDSLAAFVTNRGRLPTARDGFDSREIDQTFGSIRRAFLILKRIFKPDPWTQAAERVRQDLLVYLALAKFRGRAKYSDLDEPLREDIRALFGSYSCACAAADELLFTAGRREVVEAKLAGSPVGKLTPTGLYVHRSALMALDPLLLVYEGCARALVGSVEGANVIKLYRTRFVISYLHYPEFETAPHPSLAGSLLVELSSQEVRYRDYTEADNPPILHRKETFVLPDHPLRGKFERLTRQEETHGLFEDTARIGLKLGWQEALAQKNLRLRGHVLQRQPKPKSGPPLPASEVG